MIKFMVSVNGSFDFAQDDNIPYEDVRACDSCDLLISFRSCLKSRHLRIN